MDSEVRNVTRRARAAARELGPLPTARKNAALAALATGLRASVRTIVEANARDMQEAEARGTTGAMLDRLRLDEGRVLAMAAAVDEIRSLPDPVGEVVSRSTRPNGLSVTRVRVPLGVIAMIYEARPNVTVEASALTLKAGNAVVLRGGSEALASNVALSEVVRAALREASLPEDAVQLLASKDRDVVRALVQETEFVDLAIPRGGESLIRFVTEHARVPVVQHYKGVCHIYLDAGCNLDRAIPIVLNGKLQRPGVCNALECLLVDAADAARLLPPIAAKLAEGGCELRGCVRARALLPSMKEALPGDYGREFLDRILAVRVVDGLPGALAHIQEYGSGHTEAILTEDPEHADRFRREVDAACVVVNASTRFHDGGELGLGAEIGIATSRLHWRGPMGLEALTTMKWLVDGEGHVRG